MRLTLLPHQRIYSVFFIFGLTLGALLSRLPDLQVSLHLTDGQLGLTLIAMSTGALFGLTLSSPLIERFGARTTAFVSVLAPSVLYAIVPWMPSAPFVVPLFFIAGFFAGMLEINVNLETDRHEAVLGYRIMSRAHGMWSLGFFVTAFISAGVRQLGISVQAHTLGALIVVTIASVLVFSGIENAPVRADSHAGKMPLVAFPTVGLLALCLIGASPLLVEGAGIDWSGIYMRDVFKVVPFVGGLSITVFSLCMALARIFMDPVVDRYSPRIVAGGLLALAALGLAVVGLAPHPYVALVGFMLMGLGASSVYPLAVSAAAQRTDRPASVNVASLGQMTFIVFFLGPPLLGFVAQHLGIRTSYLVCLPAILASLLVIRALSPRPAKIISAPEPATPLG
jgi:MFS family permease